MTNSSQVKQALIEPLLTGRFVVFFSIYMAAVAAAAVLAFCTGAGGAGIFSLAAAYGAITTVRLAFAIFGRIAFRASGQFAYETALLVIAGLPAGLVAADAGDAAFADMLAVEFLVAGAFILSGSVALLQLRARRRVDIFYVGIATAFSFGAPLLWFQAAQYANVRWDFLLALSPFYHGVVAGRSDFSAGSAIFFALVLIAAGVALFLLARSKGKSAGEGGS